MEISAEDIVLFSLATYLVVTVGFGLINLDVDHTQPDVYDSIGLVIKKLDEGRFFHKNFLRFGNFHKHVLTLFIAPIYYSSFAVEAYFPVTEMEMIFIASRVVSLLSAIAVLVFVYLTSSEIYQDRKVGLLAGLSLVLSLGFLNQAVFATEDLLSFALLMATCYSATKYLVTDNFNFYLLSWILLGFSIGTKATAGIGLVMLVWVEVERYLNGHQALKKLSVQLVSGLQLAVLGFFISTPSIFVYPNIFLYHVSEQLSSRYVIQGYSGQFTYGLHLMNLIYALGYPLFFCLMASIFIRIYFGYKNRFRTGELGLIILVGVYFIFVGSWKNTLPHYMILLIPFLCIFSGTSITTVFDSNRGIASLFLVSLIFYCLFFTWSAFVQIPNDSRHKARQWLKRNVKAGIVIDAYGFEKYHPNFPAKAHTEIIDFRLGPNEKWQRAKKRIEQGEPNIISLAEAHYHRYVSERTRSISPTLISLLKGENPNYDFARSFGPPPVLDYSWSARFYRGFISDPLSPINQNITLLTRKGDQFS